MARRSTDCVVRFFGYFAVLRPTYIFGLLIVGLPLTAIRGVPGDSMLGNLFADYTFREGFWFGCTLFGAVWALMVTAGLSLDAERDRDDCWVYKPARIEDRRVTIPLQRASTFVLFSLLAVPGAAVVIARAESWGETAIGVILGGLLAYLVMDVMISFIRLVDWRLTVLPWKPLFFRLIVRACSPGQIRTLAFVPQWFINTASSIARRLPLPDYSFENRNRKERLTGDYAFAAWNLLFIFAVYLFLYWAFHPDGPLAGWLDALPPAGFVYLLLLLFIFLVSLLWVQFRRYRLALYIFALWIIGVNWMQNSGLADTELGRWLVGRPVHTYDVYPVRDRKPLGSLDVLAPLANAPTERDGTHTLIVVAASGGGILAAGWTTKVLGELESAHPNFYHELRLISGVSGGSVGSAYYVRAHQANCAALDVDSLRQIVESSTATSLAATAYGFAFPDLHRLIFPFWVPELDRGRLQEARWQRMAASAGGAGPRRTELLSDWSEDIRRGWKPAVIFNATVLETGERVAITPLASLRHVKVEEAEQERKWPGWTPNRKNRDDPDPAPVRRNRARTLSEFLGEPSEYSVDVWTAARLSATFSYVSPPARARLRCDEQRAPCQSGETLSPKYAPLHLIDGGYHENYGIASALEWVTRIVRHCDRLAEDCRSCETERADCASCERLREDCPFSRIALVEIRAKPVTIRDDPDYEWLAAWLGPPSGIMNSWAFAQTSANDTAVDRVIHELQQSQSGIRLESFVFEPEPRDPDKVGVPDWCKRDSTRCCCRKCCGNWAASTDEADFPLSWHLSAGQKAMINEYWRDPQNQCALQAFLRFVQAAGPPDGQSPEVDIAGGCCKPLEHVLPFTSEPAYPTTPVAPPRCATATSPSPRA